MHEAVPPRYLLCRHGVLFTCNCKRCFLISWTKSPHFMEPEVPLPYLQTRAADPYSEPNEGSPYPPILVLIALIRATCQAHFILRNLIPLVVFSKGYQPRSFSLDSFLQPPGTPPPPWALICTPSPQDNITVFLVNLVSADVSYWYRHACHECPRVSSETNCLASPTVET